jgi:outer membrane protein TolC
MFAGDDFVSGMVTFTVPLWASRSQKPRLRAARSERAAARSRSMNAARRGAAEYASYQAMRQAADDAIDILNRQIAAIDDQMTAQLTTYESGVGDYSPIIDGEIAILSLKSEIAMEKARRDTAIARMNALLVTP